MTFYLYVAAATALILLILIGELVVDLAVSVVRDFWPGCTCLQALPSEHERRPIRRGLQALVVVGLGLLLATRR